MTMETIGFGKYQESAFIEINGLPARVMVDKYKRTQLIKRNSKGRFESHLFKYKYHRSEVVSLLIGILLAEAVLMIYLLTI